MTNLFLKNLLNLKKDVDGAISIMFAILLPLIVGFIALATDTGTWYIKQRNMQSATDLAAVTAGREVGTMSSATLLAYVKSESARNGFAEADGVTITANSPPLTGTYAGNTNAVEIQLSQAQDRFFSVLNMGSDPVATARAVALRSAAGEACVLALDTSASGAVTFQGNPSVSLDGCLIAANSSSSSAISIGGSASLSAESLHTVGNYSTTGNAYTLDLDSPAVTSGSAIDDPYADLAEPSYGGCNQNNYKAKNTVTLSPGVYCGGLTVNANANVTLSPGTYYIHGGDLTVNGNANITGNGVTIVMTGTGSGVGTVGINGTANLNLSAPTSTTVATPYQGVLFYQDRDAPTSGVNSILGNASNSLKGTLYFPNQEVEFSGNSSSSSSCLRLVARLIEFRGNSGMSHNCSTIGGEDVTTEETIALVE